MGQAVDDKRVQAMVLLRGNGTAMTWGTVNGEKFCKDIKTTDLVRMVASHAQPEKFETPLPMPKGAFYYAQIGDSYRVAILKPKVILDYNLHGQIIAGVGMPNLLFLFEVNNENLIRSKVACVKNEGPITGETELYYYPFSNVYDYFASNDSGKICWGGTIMPFIKKAADLDMVVRLFLTMEKNYDLYNNRQNSEGLEYRKLLERVTGSEFDDELLVKSGYNFNQFAN